MSIMLIERQPAAAREERVFCFDRGNRRRDDSDRDPRAPFSRLVMALSTGPPEVYKNVVDVFHQAMTSSLLSSEPIYPQYLARFLARMGRDTRDKAEAGEFFLQAVDAIEDAIKLNVELQVSDSVLYTTKGDVLQQQVRWESHILACVSMSVPIGHL